MSAGTTVEPPVKRAYRSDVRFRRFVDAQRVELPRLEIQQKVNDAGMVTAKVTWLPDEVKAVFEGEGDTAAPTRFLKDCLRKYNDVRGLWRRHVPAPVTGTLSTVYLAPKIGSTAAGDAQTGAATGSPPPSTGTLLMKVFVVLALFAVVYAQWPLWRTLIDPEGSDNYRLLGLNPGASKSEIKKAFREFALTGHPDQGGSQATYLRVRTAYDELLLQKESPDDLLTEEAKEGNLYVVVFVGFILGRIYDISMLSSEFLIKLIDTRDRRVMQVSAAGVPVLAVGLFIVESGLSINSVMLVYNLYSHLVKVSTDTLPGPDHNHLKWECWRYLFVVLVPCSLLEGYLSWATFDWASVWRVLIGLLFVASFIHRHRPYVFLQHALGSRVYAAGHPVFSHNPILGVHLPMPIRVLLELAIDDVLAYALHVPTPFRAVCYVLLLLSALQALVYPYLPGAVPWGSHEDWQKCVQSMADTAQRKTESDQRNLATEARKAESAANAAKAQRDTPVTDRERREEAERDRNVQADRALGESRFALYLTVGTVCGFAALVAFVVYARDAGLRPDPEFKKFVVAMLQTLKADR